MNRDPRSNRSARPCLGLGIALLCAAVVAGCQRPSPSPLPPTPTAAEHYAPRLAVASGFGSKYTGKAVTMVLVPGGEFIMGSQAGDRDEKPSHAVNLGAFYIDTYEVTNGLYAVCVGEGVCRAPKRIGETWTDSQTYGDPRYASYPVDTVNWHMAETYCQWRGARLPTEAEWEKAARGSDGRTYPWGEGIDCSRANVEGCVGHSTPVGSYPSGLSVYGAHDMAGNVWEWVDTMFHDYPYIEHFYTQTTQYENRVARGGSWADRPESARAANRTWVHPWLAYYYSTMGFRCARSAAP